MDGLSRADAQAVNIMADTLFTWMETNLAAYNVGFEFLPVESPALMLQSQITDPVVKRYKSGRVMYRYPFGLYLRMENTDTAARIAQQRALTEITDSVLGASLSADGFTVWDIRQDTTPRIMSTDEGFDVCMVTCHIDYIKEV